MYKIIKVIALMVLALLLIVCCRAQEGVIRLTISKDSALRLIRLNPFPSFPAPEGHFLPLTNESPVDSSMFWKGVIWGMEHKKAVHDTVYVKSAPITYFKDLFDMRSMPFVNPNMAADTFSTSLIVPQLTLPCCEAKAGPLPEYYHNTPFMHIDKGLIFKNYGLQ